mgnify:FL=1
MGLIFHNRLVYLIGFIFSLFVSCNDASYELDNEFDPENLGLEPPTIFFHFPSGKINSEGIAEIDSRVTDRDTVELYAYGIDSVAGAHLQIAFDSEVINIVDVQVEGCEFFWNDSEQEPILLHDAGEEEGFLNVYLFYRPTLTSTSASGTDAMARVIFTVQDEGSAPLIYMQPSTVLRNPKNNTINLNTYGEGSINATQ